MAERKAPEQTPPQDMFGEQIERLLNLNGALRLPIADRTHVEQLRGAIPEVIELLQRAYELQYGENPWKD